MFENYTLQGNEIILFSVSKNYLNKVFLEIIRDQTVDDKLMYIPNDDKQNQWFKCLNTQLIKKVNEKKNTLL